MRHAGPASHWVERLSLEPHPEGGFFREVYRAAEQLPAKDLPQRFPGPRSTCTAIYYLLEQGQFSAFHRIRSDEIWHWHAGGALEILVLDEGQALRDFRLGPDDEFMRIVPAGRWFAARCPQSSPYALASCTVSPGFDFQDFELADRNALVAEFPLHAETIVSLTN